MATLVMDARRKVDGAGTDAWAAAFASADEWLKPLGELLREDVEQRFQQQTDPWGRAWTPHSAVTIALRSREGKPGRILIKDRYLANSFSWRVERNPPRVIIFSGGPAAAYAAAQQFGNPNNKMFGGKGAHHQFVGVSRDAKAQAAKEKRRTGGDYTAPIPARAMLPIRPGGHLEIPPRLLAEIRAEIGAAFKAALERHRTSAA